jgi:hypothetical protein
MEEEELLKKYNALYLEILMRYKDEIEKGETLYVAELPKLITPQDETVLGEVNKIKNAFQAYSFEENFEEAARQAHRYVKESIVTLSPPIQVWLKPSEVVSIGAGDTFDKAVLLCTMLIALGNISTNIITAIKDEKKKYVIYLEFKEKRFAIEIENGMREVKSKEDLLLEMGVHDEGEITAYEFNDKMYNDLS